MEQLPLQDPVRVSVAIHILHLPSLGKDLNFPLRSEDSARIHEHQISFPGSFPIRVLSSGLFQSLLDPHILNMVMNLKRRKLCLGEGYNIGERVAVIGNTYP